MSDKKKLYIDQLAGHEGKHSLRSREGEPAPTMMRVLSIIVTRPVWPLYRSILNVKWPGKDKLSVQSNRMKHGAPWGKRMEVRNDNTFNSRKPKG